MTPAGTSKIYQKTNTSLEYQVLTLPGSCPVFPCSGTDSLATADSCPHNRGRSCLFFIFFLQSIAAWKQKEERRLWAAGRKAYLNAVLQDAGKALGREPGAGVAERTAGQDRGASAALGAQHWTSRGSWGQDRGASAALGGQHWTSRGSCGSGLRGIGRAGRPALD
ncbi:unnamed protein product [Lepidochelys kempii]